MFEFQHLGVYIKAKHFHVQVLQFIQYGQLDRTSKDQLNRASFSVALNIAEGSGRFSKADRRNFFVIARGSVFECVAILDILRDRQQMEDSSFDGFEKQADELSRILYAMIRNLS